MATDDVSVDRLRELFSYDAETGIFVRRVARAWLKAGAHGGTLGKNGYYYITIDGRKYLAHRLAWLYVHGSHPAQHIDHVNGNRIDNRITNLRDVSRSVNLQNLRRATISSSTGTLGVSRDKRCGSYRAYIVVNRKQISLGYFRSHDEAAAAYLSAKRTLHAGCTI